jgi:Cu2+-exporting ATPase
MDIAAALESVSTHPIAHAFADTQSTLAASEQRVSVGEGVSGTIDGKCWRLGRESFVADEDSRSATAHEFATRVFLGVDGTIVAAFDLEDDIRPDTDTVLQSLSELDISIGLASGDQEAPVRRVAEKLGIEDFEFACTPQDKLSIIRKAQAQGEIVVMVGDGINDAPVLAGADASVAMASGALLAQTNADLIMLGDSLKPLLLAIQSARQTLRIVRQNLAWAIVYNAVALPAAAAGFVPPWAAAIGMSASSLIVVLNALRLSRFGEA